LTQSAAYSSGFRGEVPANLQCGFCKQPVQTAFYRTLNRFACQKCAMQVKGVIDKNVAHPVGLLRGGLAGLLVAVVCAVVWAAIVHTSGYAIGIVASFIGVGVGKAVFLGSGKRRGTPYQIVAAVLSALGVLGGKLMLIPFEVYDLLIEKHLDSSTLHIVRVSARVLAHLNANRLSEIFGGFDLLWAGIAIYAGWRICKALPITIAGPFPVPAPAAAPLQFDTVEENEAFEVDEEEQETSEETDGSEEV
jgi:hypothetical protein